MSTVKHLVILEIVTDVVKNFEPTEWNWYEILDMAGDETVEVVRIVEMPKEIE